MGYRRMIKRDLWEIYRLRQAGQALARIATAEGRDRKTTREYIASWREFGLRAEAAAVDQQQFCRLVEKLLPGRSDRPTTTERRLVSVAFSRGQSKFLLYAPPCHYTPVRCRRQ